MSMYGNSLYSPEQRAQMQSQMQAPYNAAMQQLQQLQQQYSPQNIQQQAMPHTVQQQATQTQSSLQVLMVSSVDEARAFRVDPMGTMTIFADTANGCFYTKKITTDGTAEFHTFRLDDTPPVAPQSAQYADIQTVSVLADEIQRLRAQVETLTEREVPIIGDAIIEHSAANPNGKRQPKPASNVATSDGQ